MINRHSFRLFFVLPAIAVVLTSIGCTSTAPKPEVIYKDREVKVPVQVQVEVPVFIPAATESLMPLTVSILNSLRGERGFTVDQIQLFLSGKIILERDDEEEKQDLVDGTAVFEDNYTRKLITFEDQTAGQALMAGYDDNETELYLCFESEDKYQLVFSAGKEDSSQFHIKYASQPDPLSGTRGSLEYGGQSYRLRFTGGTPYLMLKLDIRGMPVINPYTAPGQRVGAASAESPVPLTIDVLNRLKRSGNFAINQCQFYLYGKITLERIFEERKVYVEDGKAVFENNHTTNIITFEDQTEGLALRIVENPGETDLYLCFDTDTNNQMKFSATGEGPNTRFSLQFTPQNDPLSDARGTLEYGGQAYRLRFSGGTPYLMLPLSQTEDARTQERTAPGRKVTP